MFDTLVPFELHLEVWALIAGVIVIGFYTARVLQPLAIKAGYPAITTKQKAWFLAAVGAMWLVSDWPVHEIAEFRLYSVHMLQHLALSLVIPGMFLLSFPSWLFELFFDPAKKGWQAFRWFSKPVVAGVTFNALTLLLHWSFLVQWSADSGPLHFGLHLLIFTAGLAMWMPAIGPVKSWHLAPMNKCIYLFAMSIVPTVPGGWLVFAEGVVYRHYDTAQRLWDINVLTDQQAAGVIMKLVGGFFLWAVIATIFFRWANKELAKDRVALQSEPAGTLV